MKVYVIRLKGKDRRDYHVVTREDSSIEWSMSSGEFFKTIDEAYNKLVAVQNTIVGGLAYIKEIEIDDIVDQVPDTKEVNSV